MTRTIIRTIISAMFLGLLPSAALAHVGHGDVHSFAAGVLHPLSGLDHLLAAFAVGLWATLAGSRRPLVWPLTFIVVMTIATIAGANGMGLPLIEPAIAGSVVALGLLIALAVKAPNAIGAALIAVFALVHGQAHGAEGGAAWPYLLGLVAATAFLHVAGVLAGRMTLALDRPVLARVAGAMIAAAGVWIMVA